MRAFTDHNLFLNLLNSLINLLIMKCIQNRKYLSHFIQKVDAKFQVINN